MEMHLAGSGDGGLVVGAFVLVRGQYHLEVVEDGDGVAFGVGVGRLVVSRSKIGHPADLQLVAGPRDPVLLLDPGTYCVVAERATIGVRAVSRRRP